MVYYLYNSIIFDGLSMLSQDFHRNTLQFNWKKLVFKPKLKLLLSMASKLSKRSIYSSVIYIGYPDNFLPRQQGKNIPVQNALRDFDGLAGAVARHWANTKCIFDSSQIDIRLGW